MADKEEKEKASAKASDKVGAKKLIVRAPGKPDRIFDSDPTVHGEDFKDNAEEYAATHHGVVEKYE